MNRAILVKSCQKFRQRGQACVDTWLAELREHRVPAFIVLADREDALSDYFKLINTATGDEYCDNSLKLKSALRQLLSLLPVDSVFICDDDTFVHPTRWLAHEPAGEFECRLYHPRNKREKKLNDGRPWATGGAGWYMSRRLCELYVEQVTERCSWDDVLATRIAQDNHVEIVDRPDLYSCDRYGDSAWRVSADNPVITCHPVEPAEMVEMWEAIEK